MIQCFMDEKYENHFENGLPKLLSASKTEPEFGIHHPRVMHSHSDFIEFYFVRNGTGVYIVDGKRYSIKKGDIVVCNCGVLHDEDVTSSNEISSYCCAIGNLKLKNLPDNFAIPADACPIVPTNELYDSFHALLNMMHTLLASDVKGVEETCHYLAAAFVALFVQTWNANRQHTSGGIKTGSELLAARIKQFIDTRYDEPITLQMIGDALGASPYYLSHVFKDMTGYSPMQYATRRRIGEAQSLLIYTSMPVTYIAARVGYSNQSHFNSLFSKYVGMSPTQFRKEYAKKR